jgi:anti-sigma factor RsiW
MTSTRRPSARCRALFEELSRYLDGELTPARCRTIERHIGNCVCCGTMAARLRLTLAACRAERQRRPPRAVMARAAARVRALMASRRASS